MKHRYEYIFKQVSDELDIPVEVVKLAYNSCWRFALKTIKEMPIDVYMTEDEFRSFKSSFHFPFMGDLYLSYDKMSKSRRHLDWIKNNLNDKSKEG